MSTPTQAPVMSREEWEDRIAELVRVSKDVGFNDAGYGYNPSKREVEADEQKAALLESVMALQAEVERLREDVKHERNVNAFLMAAGNALGNIAYNGAQSERVPEDYRKSMKEAVTDWDKAREKARQPK